MIGSESHADQPAPLEEIPSVASYLRSLESGLAEVTSPPGYEGSAEDYYQQQTEEARQKLYRGIDIATGQLVMARSIGKDDANLITVGSVFTNMAPANERMYSDTRVALAIGECLGLSEDAEHCIILRGRPWVYHPKQRYYLVPLDNPVTGQPSVALQSIRQLKRGPRRRTSFAR
jgi:hypothetical protein